MSNTFLRQRLPFQIYTNFKFVTFNKYVKITQYNFRKDTIRKQMSKSTNVSDTFLRQLLPFQIYINFKFRPLKSRSRSRSTIFAITPFDGNCQSPPMSPTYFALARTVSDIQKFKTFHHQKVGRGHGVQSSQLHQSMTNIKIC